MRMSSCLLSPPLPLPPIWMVHHYQGLSSFISWNPRGESSLLGYAVQSAVSLKLLTRPRFWTFSRMGTLLLCSRGRWLFWVQGAFLFLRRAGCRTALSHMGFLFTLRPCRIKPEPHFAPYQPSNHSYWTKLLLCAQFCPECRCPHWFLGSQQQSGQTWGKSTNGLKMEKTVVKKQMRYCDRNKLSP